MNIHAIQFDIAWEDREANHRKVRELLLRSKPSPGDLVALPEMFSTGFSMNVDAIAEDASLQSEQFICNLARELGCCIVAGVVSRGSNGRGRNEAFVCGPDGTTIARYAKLHPFIGGEQQHYEAGEDIITFAWHGFTVSPFVCYDLRFPEIFRHATARGANLFCVIASWPIARVNHWITLLQARAIENQAYVVGVNRIGSDPSHTYPGRSLIVDPSGAILADAGESKTVLSAEVSLDLLLSYRAQHPFLKDMRITFSTTDEHS